MSLLLHLYGILNSRLSGQVVIKHRPPYGTIMTLRHLELSKNCPLLCSLFKLVFERHF